MWRKLFIDSPAWILCGSRLDRVEGGGQFRHTAQYSSCLRVHRVIVFIRASILERGLSRKGTPRLRIFASRWYFDHRANTSTLFAGRVSAAE